MGLGIDLSKLPVVGAILPSDPLYAVILFAGFLGSIFFLRSLFVVLHQAEAIILLQGTGNNVDINKGTVYTEPGLYLVKWPFQSCIVISTALRHMKSDFIMVKSTDGKEVGIQVMIECGYFVIMLWIYGCVCVIQVMIECGSVIMVCVCDLSND